MTETLKFYAYDTLKTTAAVMAVSALNIPGYLSNVLPSGNPGLYLADGISYALARDLVNQVSGGGSNLMNMNYVALLDDTAYFAIASGVTDGTGVNTMLYDNISKLSPLSQNVNMGLTNGAIISGATAVANLLDVSTGNNMLFDFIRRPVSTTYQRLTGY